MQNEHRAYEKAFMIEAVRLVQTSGKSISQVAKDLGIPDSNLCRWCRDHENEVSKRLWAVGIKPSRKRKFVV